MLPGWIRSRRREARFGDERGGREGEPRLAGHQVDDPPIPQLVWPSESMSPRPSPSRSAAARPIAISPSPGRVAVDFEPPEQRPGGVGPGKLDEHRLAARRDDHPARAGIFDQRPSA